MKQVTVTWMSNRDFIGTDSGNHSIVISGSSPNIGMKPSELLLLALGSCTGYDVVQILEKRRKPVDGLKIIVTGEQEPDPPWAFRKVHIHYEVTGEKLTADEIEKAIKLSKEKYCSVSATVAHAAEVTYDFELMSH